MYACWLDTIYWLAGEAKYKLFGAAGSAKAVYGLTERQVSALVGIKGCERFMQQKRRCQPQAVWKHVASLHVKYTYCGAPDFPQKLAGIPDPPFGIFYKGELPGEKTPALAIIGARKCSEYGKCMAENFAGNLAKRGVNIISGMALGIDGISQKAAIKAGGRSYGVLGCGVDVVYPKANETLYKQLAENGGILSEYPPGMEPRPILFPPRNRIISALSDAVLVVEAREKSGTLITVDMALEQGREVYAIPGRCTDSLSTGCNRLLRQGAGIAMAPQDIIEDMHWEGALAAAGSATGQYSRENGAIKTMGLVSRTAQAVYSVLDILPMTRDDIIMKLREKEYTYTVQQICQGLVELELKNLIARQNGQYGLSSGTVLDG